MINRHFKIVTALIGCIILASFLVSVLHTRDNAEKAKPVAVVLSMPIPSVALRDTYKKGTHAITGSIVVPDACTTPTVIASLQGATSTTESILIAVSFPLDTDICLETQTAVSFKTTLVAPAGLPITATVNGTLATTTSL